jgi:hypothetical protein
VISTAEAVFGFRNRPRHSDAATQQAIAHHVHMLLLHPASDSFDVQAAFYKPARQAWMRTGSTHVFLPLRQTFIEQIIPE